MNEVMTKIYKDLYANYTDLVSVFNGGQGIRLNYEGEKLSIFFSVEKGLTVMTNNRDKSNAEFIKKCIQGNVSETEDINSKKNAAPKKETTATKTDMMPKKDIDVDATFYTDGSHNAEHNVAGWSFTCSDGHEAYGAKRNAVSRQVDGEANAVVFALKYAATKGYKTVKIAYDYEGIESWITGEWKAESEIAVKYVQHFNAVIKENNLTVVFEKVKAHAGVSGNMQADKLAKIAVRKEIAKITGIPF